MKTLAWVLVTTLAMLACGTRAGRTGESGNPPPGADAVVPAVDAGTGNAGSPGATPAAGGQTAGPTDAERRLLLSLARAAIQTRLAGEGLPTVDASCATEYLSRPLACFVTLNTSAGDLRGCIGMFEAERPLWENVMDRARAAAFSDGRFSPVRESELPGLVLDISILTAPQPFAFSSPEDLLARLRPLVDGVILHSPWGTSTFLPQVWEQLPDKEEFLGHLCEKHGAPAGCWRNPELRVETYEAIVFSEHALPPRDTDWFTVDANGRYTCTAPPEE